MFYWNFNWMQGIRGRVDGWIQRKGTPDLIGSQGWFLCPFFLFISCFRGRVLVGCLFSRCLFFSRVYCIFHVEIFYRYVCRATYTLPETFTPIYIYIKFYSFSLSLSASCPLLALSYRRAPASISVKFNKIQSEMPSLQRNPEYA